VAEFSARAPGRDGRLRQVAAWVGAAVVYGAAQGLSAWVARYAQGRGTRPQYEQFERPAFAPPGAVFPVVWPALNLTTATSAWLVWRAGEAGPGAPSRRAVLAWWALAVIVRSGYVPLAFGSRRLWAATWIGYQPERSAFHHVLVTLSWSPIAFRHRSRCPARYGGDIDAGQLAWDPSPGRS